MTRCGWNRRLAVACVAGGMLAGCSQLQSKFESQQTKADRQRQGVSGVSQLANASQSPDRSGAVRQMADTLPKTWNGGDMALDPRLEEVATFDGPMQTGVTVSQKGRIFVNFPKWGDPVGFTVAEIRDGKAVAYPSEAINTTDKSQPGKTLISVQSVVVDPRDRLWILDTGSVQFGPVQPDGAKLVCVDLNNDQVVKTIVFPRDVALADSYVNDVRFDLTRGSEGFAFVTDSSQKGDNGIIVVDLGSGKSWRRLSGHPSVLPTHDLMPNVEGKPLGMRPLPASPPQPMTMGSDGIAISADGKQLFYTPLISTHLYSVSTDALADQNRSEQDVASTVKDLGERNGSSDGLESDSAGRVYLTDYQHAAIQRRSADGNLEAFVQDPRLIWPDTLSLASDGYLYVSVNQLDRMSRFQGGKDLRQHPYVLFRIKTDSKPVMLTK